MRFVSCFSGIEAASVATKSMGWRPILFSEIDKFASAVLEHHYPDVPNLGDMTKINWKEHSNGVDIVCGGSPCQAFSVAGLRKSLEDPRGNLTLEFMRSIHQIKSRWIMWENVPGTFSATGNPFGAFLAGLCGFDESIEPPKGKWANSGWVVANDEESYSVAWRVLDAQHFGVPQRRKRIFLVGHLGKTEWWKPLEVLFERNSKIGDLEASGETWQETSRVIRESVAPLEDQGGSVMRFTENAKSVGTLRRETHEREPVVFFAQNQLGEIRTGNVANTLSTNSNPSGRETPMVAIGGTNANTGGNGCNFSEEISPTLDRTNSQYVCHTFDRQSSGEYGEKPVASTVAARDYKSASDLVVFAPRSPDGSPRVFGNTSETLNTAKVGQRTPCVAIQGNMIGRSDTADPQGSGFSEDLSFTLTKTDQHGVCVSDTIVRRLTPKECARLQGFPDDYLDIMYKGKPAPDSLKYKALGNSWAVPCAKWIFERIDNVSDYGMATTPKT